MRLGTTIIAIVVLVGVTWLWVNIEMESMLLQVITVGVLGLVWAGIVLTGAGIFAAILGAGAVITGRKE